MTKNPQFFHASYYESEPWKAIPALASHLFEGSLSLIIGAGASKDLGFPAWYELVKKCVNDIGVILDFEIDEKTDNTRLCRAMDKVERKISGRVGQGEYVKFRNFIKEHLYENITYPQNIITKELLIALGALLINSRRGHVSEIFNFNFDDVLEYYLNLLGVDVQAVTILPCLERKPDVAIFHPHGFLPKYIYTDKESDFLTLSQFSYDLKFGAAKDDWLEKFESILLEKMVLFIGISGDDQTFGSKLAIAKNKLKGKRPTGFWFCKKGAVNDDQLDFFKDRNVIPLIFKDYNEMPGYLLNLCQFSLTYL